MGKRLDVKTAASDDNRHLVAGTNFFDGTKRKTPKFRRVHFLQDRHRTDQMMRRSRECRGIRFPAKQVEAAVDLKRIRANDLGAEFVSDVRSELGFSRGSGTDNEIAPVHSPKKKSGDARYYATSPD